MWEEVRERISFKLALCLIGFFSTALDTANHPPWRPNCAGQCSAHLDWAVPSRTGQCRPGLGSAVPDWAVPSRTGQCRPGLGSAVPDRAALYLALMSTLTVREYAR